MGIYLSAVLFAVLTAIVVRSWHWLMEDDPPEALPSCQIDTSTNTTVVKLIPKKDPGDGMAA